MYILNRKFISNSKDQWVLLRLYEESYESSNDFALKFVSNSSCSIIIEIGRKIKKMLVLLGIEGPFGLSLFLLKLKAETENTVAK